MARRAIVRDALAEVITALVAATCFGRTKPRTRPANARFDQCEVELSARDGGPPRPAHGCCAPHSARFAIAAHRSVRRDEIRAEVRDEL